MLCWVPLQVLEGLLTEGYNVSYRRIPLSRERTPEAEDVDQLHQQLVGQLGKAHQVGWNEIRQRRSRPAGALEGHQCAGS